MTSILFVCRRNACRSQMAEAICRNEVPRSWLVASAGFEHAPVPDPRTVDALRRHGLVVGPAKPKGFQDLPEVEWDYVVFLGEGEMPALPEAKKVLQWPIAEPAEGALQTDEVFKTLAERIEGLLRFNAELSRA